MDKKLLLKSLDKIAAGIESIAASLNKIANPPIVISGEPGPHDVKICTCTMDPASRDQCAVHGDQER